jgi:hypothetical protein
MDTRHPRGVASPYAGRERRQTPRWPVSQMCTRCGAATPSSADVLCVECLAVFESYPPHVPEELRLARGVLLIGPLAAAALWLVLVIICAVMFL